MLSNASASSSLLIDRAGFFRRATFDGTEFAARVNGGVDVYITPQLSIIGQGSWVIPTDTLGDLEYTSGSIGVRYIF